VVLLLVSVGIPLVFFVSQAAMARFLPFLSWQSDFCNSALGFLYCLGSAECVTSYFKLHIGRPRPNHLALVNLRQLSACLYILA
jgi:hypothetical protein